MADRFFRPRRRTTSKKTKKEKTPFFTPNKVPIQTRLEVGPVDDPYEKEADAMGEKAAEAGGDAREFMESEYNYSFKQVNIHTGAKSEKMNQALKAKAFTQGHHIHFNKGNYQPKSKEGKKLLAHELTHVVQQGRGAGPTIQRTPDPEAEQSVEAETPLSFEQFQETAKTLYGVKTIRVGTMEDQLIDLVLKTDSPIPNWEPWYFGSTSVYYNYIISAFRDFQNSFGATPNIDTITFYPIHYTRTTTPPIIVNKLPEVPAAYKNQELKIYKNIWTADFVLPFARSNPEGEYGPGTPIAVAEYESDPNAAPVEGFPDKSDAVNRVVLHELAHGLSTDVRTGTTESPVVDASMIEDYKTTVGWRTELIESPPVEGKTPPAIEGDTHLYDLMAPEVQKAITEKAALPSAFIIIPDRWNDSNWVDQPISKYAVEGGPGEDFAESIRAYIENPELLASRSPLRYNFIHSRKDQWAAAMRSSSPEPTPEAPATDTPTPGE